MVLCGREEREGESEKLKKFYLLALNFWSKVYCITSFVNKFIIFILFLLIF